MIGKLNTRISIYKRSEIGPFQPFNFDDQNQPKGNPIDYGPVYETWADADYTSSAKKFKGRAVGKSTGDTAFIIRNVDFEIEKDFYVDAKGYRYQVHGTMPADDKFRFLFLDCSFVGKAGDNG